MEAVNAKPRVNCNLPQRSKYDSVQSGKILHALHFPVACLLHQSLHSFSLIITDLKKQLPAAAEMLLCALYDFPVKIQSVCTAIQRLLKTS